ncbi:MvdC/MvdD family ATP grasp protein [Pleionea litopenaei]|uniref:MvdD-like pre-ATP grasp domain-containing protein n=1 Tax=Pleionea litopenaei TaxID=3070815 RepID=A0AA51RX80_9GAMM|nr:hypothetical protein [Pleionea sp. HL-JVS1]WMS89113.1 hypothetical protein Q9312_09440 [Pleionea sp. HL-JVS1]
MSNKLLIPTYSGDIHAVAVEQAIRQKGHDCYRWHATDFPTKQYINYVNVGTHSDATYILLDELQGEFNIADFDTVWHRRPSEPVLPKDLHEGDRIQARRESIALAKSIWHFVNPNAFWVNHFNTVSYSGLKPLQLKIAKQVGLKIPDTLISNQPEQIREFIKLHQGNLIYKPLNQLGWTGEDRFYSVITSKISEEDLPSDEYLRLSPGIFQPYQEKAYELRVTFMGKMPIAAKLHSQDNASTVIDWRTCSYSKTEMTVSPYQLPDKIVEQCWKLMQQLGIVFGCFDFIVTPDREYIFLEVNPMGQFLWVEELNPDIMMLDAFSEFLLAKTVDFQWAPSKSSIRYEGTLKQTANNLNADDRNSHLEPERTLFPTD